MGSREDDDYWNDKIWDLEEDEDLEEDDDYDDEDEANLEAYNYGRD